MERGQHAVAEGAGRSSCAEAQRWRDRVPCWFSRYNASQCLSTLLQDLGNTNFSIHLARRAFDRRTTAALVLRAVQSLGIPRARLNDRNDLCVGEDKMSPALPP